MSCVFNLTVDSNVIYEIISYNEEKRIYEFISDFVLNITHDSSVFISDRSTMNFKNSKFYKRIQELRNFSKEKVRKELESEYRPPALLGVQMALSEEPHEGQFNWAHILPQQSTSPRRKKKEKVKMVKKKIQELGIRPINLSETNHDVKVDGYIELNKLRYRVPCSGIPEPSPQNYEVSRVW